MDSYLKYIYSIVLLLLMSFMANGQEYLLKGRVLNQENDPIEYVHITLLENNTFIKDTFTDSLGNYTLRAEENKYDLLFKHYGEQHTIKGILLVQDTILDEYILNESVLLSEIEISSYRKRIEQKTDRLVFNLEDSPASMGMDALEALSITPMLNVSENGVSIVGKSNVGVMINGRMINLSAGVLANYLKTIRSENIKSIEVITTPPAKYEAQGSGGLINIILKKDVNSGFNAMASTTFIQRNSLSNLSNVLVNYSSKKIQVSTMLGYAKQKKQQRDFSHYYFDNSNQMMESSNKDNKMENPLMNVKINYNLSERSTIGLILDIGKQDASSKALNGINQDNNLGNRFYDYKRNLKYNYKTSNIYFDQKLGAKDNLLSFSFNYFDRHSDDNGATVNQNNERDGIHTLSEFSFKIYTGQVDLSLPYEKFTIESGIKYASFINNSNTSYLILPELYDAGNFKYKEDNFALYASIENKWSAKFRSKFGLRYELSDIHLKSLNSDFSYDNLFPSLHLKYAINESNILSLGYSKRIDRPSSENYNPFKKYSNPYTYTIGNPIIKPYYSHNYDLSYTLNNNFNVRLYSTIRKNVIGSFFYESAEDIMVKTYDNLYNASSYGIDLSYTFLIYKQLQIYSSWNTYYNQTKSNNGLVPRNSGWANYLYLNGNLKLVKSGNIQLSTSYWHYFPRHEDNLYWNNRSNLSTSVKFFLLSRSLQINIIARDILNQDRAKYTSYINGGYQNVNNYFQNRDFRISILYAFGNKKIRSNNKQIKLEEKYRISE